MSHSLESQDLPVAPLPLTQIHRDELNEAIHKRVRRLRQLITESAIPADEFLVTIVLYTIQEASRFLRRENKKDTLDADMGDEQTLKQYPQLRDIIRTAFQTSSFDKIADLSEYLCNLIPMS